MMKGFDSNHPGRFGWASPEEVERYIAQARRDRNRYFAELIQRGAAAVTRLVRSLTGERRRRGSAPRRYAG